MISMLALSLGMGGPAVSGLPPGDPSCASGCAVGPFTAVNNMNGQYTVAGEPPGFSTVSADYDKGNVEYFDIYSPLVKTRYSQVYWTMMKSVPLPPALVKRFEGKVMAVTGWESDQVIKDPATNGSDFSIPITWAYNHHYGNYINGKDSVLEEVEVQSDKDPNNFMGHATVGEKVWTTSVRANDSNATSRFPAATVFATGNGGEYRKSFHSYAAGYAQLVESPVSWAIQPMQIDTWNRDGSMASPGMPFAPGPYPAEIAAPGGTHAPRSGPDAVYSGLLECPCTDRITRSLGASATAGCTAKVTGSCQMPVKNAAMCETAAAQMAANVAAPQGPANAPAQCTFQEHPGTYLAGLVGGAPSSFGSLSAAQEWCCAKPAGACGGITYQPDPMPTYTARKGTAATPFKMRGLSSWIMDGARGVPFQFSTGTSSTLPRGCSLTVAANGSAVSGYFNTHSSAVVACGGKPGSRKVRGTGAAGNVSLSIALDEAANAAIITLQGPAAVWFGVAFDAVGMASQPYAIVVEGGSSGAISERKLGVHAPGTLLQPSVAVVASSVSGGRRTVVLRRKLSLADYEHDFFTFDVTATSMPYIAAVGASAKYAYHKAHYGATLSLFAADAQPTCVCAGRVPAFGDTADGVLHYNASGLERFGDAKNGQVGFGKHCVGSCPADNLNCSEWATILDQRNPTCDVRAYRGGLGCCHHLYYLLDKNQSHLIPDQQLQYHMKMRFYFQEYRPAKHKQLFRWHWQTATGAGEYDVPQCPKGTPTEMCTHTIKAKIQVKDFAAGSCNYRSGLNVLTPECKPGSTGFKPILLGGHCHAPTCISMSMRNEDTGELICRNLPTYGHLKSGSNGTKRFEEDGYLALPPCLWSEDPASGLPAPPLLLWETNLTTIKICNSTYGHTGEMGRWQGHGIIV